MSLRSTLEHLFVAKAVMPDEATAAEIEEFVHFRNRIYVEKGYVPTEELSDKPDPYDKQSVHISIRKRKDESLTGYCRLIFNEPLRTPLLVLKPELNDRIRGLSELSRFCVRSHWRGRLNPRNMAPLFLLGLELMRLSRQQHLNRLCCLIDRHFQILCQRNFKMHFDILGEPVDYMGSLCVPCLLDLPRSIQNNLNNPVYTAFWDTKEIQEWVTEFAGYEH